MATNRGSWGACNTHKTHKHEDKRTARAIPDLGPLSSQPQCDGPEVLAGVGQGSHWTGTVPDEGLAEVEKVG